MKASPNGAWHMIARISLYLGAAALFTLAAACGGQDSAPAADASPADKIFVNGHIYTANESRAFADAFALRGDELLAIGAAADMDALSGPETETIDLGGRLVLPGLHDAHILLISVPVRIKILIKPALIDQRVDLIFGSKVQRIPISGVNVSVDTFQRGF